MVQITELPFEMLQAILTILAMSCDGARDLARASATCKMFMTLARQSDILRTVNFQNVVVRLSRGSQEHYHVNGLLFRCARAGNLSAECLLGKALLQRRMCSKDVLRDGRLQHQRLVRSFIQHGRPEDVIDMQYNLRRYITFFAGLDAARKFCSVDKFLFYNIARSGISGTRNIETEASPLIGSSSPSPQERLRVCFDRVFPPNPM